jgi:hypothetical protein
MPLLDQFHPPLSTLRLWESFHAQWAGAIASELNFILPADYFAETRVHIGPRVEVDVTSLRSSPHPTLSYPPFITMRLR